MGRLVHTRILSQRWTRRLEFDRDIGWVSANYLLSPLSKNKSSNHKDFHYIYSEMCHWVLPTNVFFPVVVGKYYCEVQVEPWVHSVTFCKTTEHSQALSLFVNDDWGKSIKVSCYKKQHRLLSDLWLGDWSHLFSFSGSSFQNSAAGKSCLKGNDVCVPMACTLTAATWLALWAISSRGNVG